MPQTLHYNWNNVENSNTLELSLTDVQSGVALALTRDTNATVKDYNGYIRTALAGNPRFQGARWTEQLIVGDIDNWTTSEASVTDAGLPICLRSRIA